MVGGDLACKLVVRVSLAITGNVLCREYAKSLGLFLFFPRAVLECIIKSMFHPFHPGVKRDV